MERPLLISAEMSMLDVAIVYSVSANPSCMMASSFFATTSLFLPVASSRMIKMEKSRFDPELIITSPSAPPDIIPTLTTPCTSFTFSMSSSAALYPSSTSHSVGTDIVMLIWFPPMDGSSTIPMLNTRMTQNTRSATATPIGRIFTFKQARIVFSYPAIILLNHG